VPKQSTMKRNAMALQEMNPMITNTDRDLIKRAKNKQMNLK
jgi:23S rRNA maturation mini-RNase III